jgi:hypothetical protein
VLPKTLAISSRSTSRSKKEEKPISQQPLAKGYYRAFTQFTLDIDFSAMQIDATLGDD